MCLRWLELGFRYVCRISGAIKVGLIVLHLQRSNNSVYLSYLMKHMSGFCALDSAAGVVKTASYNMAGTIRESILVCLSKRCYLNLKFKTIGAQTNYCTCKISLSILNPI